MYAPRLCTSMPVPHTLLVSLLALLLHASGVYVVVPCIACRCMGNACCTCQKRTWSVSLLALFLDKAALSQVFPTTQSQSPRPSVPLAAAC